MHVYLTTNPHGNVFSGPELDTLPHFVWRNITFGDWSDTRTVEYDVHLPLVSRRPKLYFQTAYAVDHFQSVQRNGSMWADIFLVKDGADPNPASPNFDWNSVARYRKCK